ncbi:MAG: hypothetical protein CMF06_07020 [Hyphomonas sp.]|nr:hypothetical protein [Hyphomonas sp.]
MTSKYAGLSLSHEIEAWILQLLIFILGQIFYINLKCGLNLRSTILRLNRKDRCSASRTSNSYEILIHNCRQLKHFKFAARLQAHHGEYQITTANNRRYCFNSLSGILIDTSCQVRPQRRSKISVYLIECRSFCILACDSNFNRDWFGRRNRYSLKLSASSF